MSTRLKTLCRKRIEQIRDEAIGLAGAATRMAEACNEVLGQGGVLLIDPQLAYVTGAYARLLKDYGVVGHFKSEGIVPDRPPPTR